jgi:catechol 2,3-dioxygenase-like lactoylglutathione lyase family enzyme
MVTFQAATPALPVRDVPRAVTFYRERLGFVPLHEDRDFSVLRRDSVEVILWEANQPTVPGAEPHLAGTASCRIQVSGLRELYASCQAQQVIHPNGALTRQPWGVDDFSVLDSDGNLLGFYEPVGD